jgi:hypothetical protein
MQKDVVGHVSSVAAWKNLVVIVPRSVHADAPPAGLADVHTSLLPDELSMDIVTQKAVPGTHATGPRKTPLPSGSVADLHVEAPPAGLVEVITWAAGSVATHSDVSGQDTSRTWPVSIGNGLDQTSVDACADAGVTTASTTATAAIRTATRTDRGFVVAHLRCHRS